MTSPFTALCRKVLLTQIYLSVLCQVSPSLGCLWLFNNEASVGPLKEIGIHSANIMCPLVNIRFLLMSKQAFLRPLEVTQFWRRMRQRTKDWTNFCIDKWYSAYFNFLTEKNMYLYVSNAIAGIKHATVNEVSVSWNILVGEREYK